MLRTPILPSVGQRVTSQREEGLLSLLAPEALGHCDPTIFMIEEEKPFSPLSSPAYCKWCGDLNVVNSNSKSELLLAQRCPEGVGSVDEICSGYYGEVCL